MIQWKANSLGISLGFEGKIHKRLLSAREVVIPFCRPYCLLPSALLPVSEDMPGC